MLLRAAAEGQTPRVRHLLRLGSDIDFADSDELTVLHHAVLSGYEDVVELLLRRGADVNAHSTNWGTPLCLAILRDRMKIVDILVKGRAKIDFVTKRMGTAFHCAVYTGNIDVLKALLATRSDRHIACTVNLPLLERLAHRSESDRIPAAVAACELAMCTPSHLVCFTKDCAGILKLLEPPFNIASAHCQIFCKTAGTDVSSHKRHGAEPDITCSCSMILFETNQFPWVALLGGMSKLFSIRDQEGHVSLEASFSGENAQRLRKLIAPNAATDKIETGKGARVKLPPTSLPRMPDPAARNIAHSAISPPASKRNIPEPLEIAEAALKRTTPLETRASTTDQKSPRSQRAQRRLERYRAELKSDSKHNKDAESQSTLEPSDPLSQFNLNVPSSQSTPKPLDPADSIISEPKVAPSGSKKYFGGNISVADLLEKCRNGQSLEASLSGPRDRWRLASEFSQAQYRLIAAGFKLNETRDRWLVPGTRAQKQENSSQTPQSARDTPPQPNES